MSLSTRPHARRHLLLPVILVAFFSAAISLAHAQTSAFSGPFLGLTDDPCRTQDDCHPTLHCKLLRRDGPPTQCDPLNNESCSCVPDRGLHTLCKTSADCPRHERCIAVNGDASTGAARCSSCTAFFMIDSVTKPVDDSSTVCPQPTPTPIPRGFALDECDPSRATPCRSFATCARFEKDTLVSCKPGDTLCDCQPRETFYCTNSAHCPPGERCVARGFEPDKPTQCISCVVAQNNPQIFRLADLHAPSCHERHIPTVTPRPSTASEDEEQPHCPRSNGVTFDHCCAHPGARRCAFPRRCTSVFTKEQCRPGEVSCVCLSPATSGCEKSENCPLGELCVRNGEFNTCVSCSRVTAGRIFETIDDGAVQCKDAPSLPVVSIPEYPSPSVGPALHGSEEESRHSDEDVEEPSSSGELDSSAQPDEPHRRDPLLEGEAEAQRGLPNEVDTTMAPAPSSEASGPEDTSEIPSPSPSPSSSTATTNVSEGVCVGAHHLSDLPASALVFSRHVQARVLCDATRSCATPGHIVVWHGVPMSMRSYCDRAAACTLESMLVNSVRMSRGARVQSKTPGLGFTALAARWGSRVEEAMLGALVRFGL